MPNRKLLRPFKTLAGCQKNPKVALFSQPANHRLLALDYDHFMLLLLAFPRNHRSFKAAVLRQVQVQ